MKKEKRGLAAPFLLVYIEIIPGFSGISDSPG